MKIANNLQLLILITACLFFNTEPLWAHGSYKEFKRDFLEMDLSSDYFRSEANYLTSGSSTNNLFPGNYYQLLDVKLSGRYMPRPNWSVFVSGTVGSAESKSAAVTRGNSTLSEGLLGVDFILFSKIFQIIPEFSVLVPFEKIDNASDDVLNTEGVFELRMRVNIQKDFGALRSYAWLGYHYRDEGRSHLLPYGVGTQIRWRRILIGGEIFGFESITSDTDTNTFARSTYINTVNGGSMKFYSVDPSVMDTNLYFSWLPAENLALQLRGGTTVMGSNMAAGYHVGASLKYAFDLGGLTLDEPAENPLPSDNSNNRKKVRDQSVTESFRENTDDGINQDLFREESEKLSPQNSQVVDENLQRQLDEAEIKIDLKSKKKRKK